jgi:hypothetical protein
MGGYSFRALTAGAGDETPDPEGREAVQGKLARAPAMVKPGPVFPDFVQTESTE